MFVKAKNKKIIEYPYEMAHIRRDHKNAIFSGNSPSHTFMEKYDIHRVYEDIKPVPEGTSNSNAPTYNAKTHYLQRAPKPKNVNDTWVLDWKIKKKTKKMLEKTTKIESSTAIETRNKLLQESDWIVVRAYERKESVPVEWCDYREKLRSIEDQKNFPLNIVWPVSPKV